MFSRPCFFITLTIAGLLLSVAPCPAQAPPATYIYGYHGGLFTATRPDNARAVKNLVQLANDQPSLFFNLDIESYMLDRMAHGARLGVENQTLTVDGWTATMNGLGRWGATHSSAHSGSWGLRADLDSGAEAIFSQNISLDGQTGKRVVFSAWVRSTAGMAGIENIMRNATGSTILDSHEEQQVPADGKWHQLTITFTIPSEAVMSYPRMKLWGAGSNGDFDDALFLIGNQSMFTNGDLELTSDPWYDPATVASLRDLVQSGRAAITSPFCQPLLFGLDDESLVRHFSYGRRIVRDTLGVDFDSYVQREPAWCGQLPAILSGFDFRGVFAGNSFNLFGQMPTYNAESVFWQGPDGSQIPAIPYGSYAVQSSPSNGKLAQIPDPSHVQAANNFGISDPVFMNLADNFLPSAIQNPATSITTPVVFKSVPDYLAGTTPKDTWKDPFYDFQSRMCWGTGGGYILRQSQDCVNRAVLAERLALLTGLDWSNDVRSLWELAMLTQQHDLWLNPDSIAGVYQGHYADPAAFVNACWQESSGRLAALVSRSPSKDFLVVNPTQYNRDEWIPVNLEIPEGYVESGCVIYDNADQQVPSQLKVAARNYDNSIKTLTGYMRATIDGFRTRSYTVQSGTNLTSPPVQVQSISTGGYALINDKLRVEVRPSSITLQRAGQTVLTNLSLQATIDGVPSNGYFYGLSGQITSDGIAEGQAMGIISDLPVKLVLHLKPWSDTLDMQVTAYIDGQEIEGSKWWDQNGNLKLVLSNPRIAPFPDMQAESAFLTGVNTVSNQYASGFMATSGFREKDDQINFVYMPHGTGFRVRYAQGSGRTQQCTLLIDGVLSGKMYFPDTGGWSNFRTIEVPKAVGGIGHSLRFYVYSDDAAANTDEVCVMDKVTITGVDSSSGSVVHMPFEIRVPNDASYWSTQYVLTQWAKGTDAGSGFCTLLDRPSGVVFADGSVQISLAHSGQHPYGSGAVYPSTLGSDQIYGGQCEYEVSIFPFLASEREMVVGKYQCQAYPLTVMPAGSITQRAIQNLSVTGHSVVTGFYQDDDGIFLRFWNPLWAESTHITTPGSHSGLSNMAGKVGDIFTSNSFDVPIDPLQIRTIRMDPPDAARNWEGYR